MLLKKAFQLPQWLLFRRGQAAVALVCLWLLAIALPGVHVSRRSAPLMRIATATHTERLSASLPVDPRMGRYVIVTTIGICVAAFTFMVWKVHRRMQRDQEMVYEEHAKNPWQGFLALILLGALIALAVWWIWRHPLQMEQIVATSSTLPAQTVFSDQESPPPSDFSDQPLQNSRLPRLAILGAVVLALAVAGLIAWFFNRLFHERRSDQSDIKGYDVVTMAGGGVSVQPEESRAAPCVIQSYRDACRLLSSKAALESATTTREFLDELRRVGVHDREVFTLTRLFEDLRYGHHAMNAAQEEKARMSLHTLYARYRRPSDDV